MKMNRIKWKETLMNIPPAYYGDDGYEKKDTKVNSVPSHQTGISEEAIFNITEDAVVFDTITQENTKTSFNIPENEETTISETVSYEPSNNDVEEEVDTDQHVSTTKIHKYNEEDIQNLDSYINQYLDDDNDNEIKVVESFEPILISYADEEEQPDDKEDYDETASHQPVNVVKVGKVEQQNDESLFEFLEYSDDTNDEDTEDNAVKDYFGDGEKDTNFEEDDEDDYDFGKDTCDNQGITGDLSSVIKLMDIPNSIELLEKMYDIYKKTM